MKKVLITEDDANIVNILKIHLMDLNFDINIAGDGNTGLSKALAEQFDLIILDVMLPGLDGISICQKLRAAGNFTPIIMLTAKSEELDKVLGLECGADDYLTKPFSIREFIARVKAIVRRQDNNRYTGSTATAKSCIAYDALVIDLEKRRVTLQGKRIE